jgi:Mn2+/Fe2+ NRAMP family transporter
LWRVCGDAINFPGINPVDALFRTAVLNGFLAPPLMVLVMLMANNKKIMGKHTNGSWINVRGWCATVAMFAAAAGRILTWRQALIGFRLGLGIGL